jgi:flagellar hook-basal body complex protein FliE
MVERISSPGSELARAAIEAARASHARMASELSAQAPLAAPQAIAPKAAESPSFAQALIEGVRGVDASVHSVDELPLEVATGKVGDFHEVALKLKESELSFRFALEVRNKLIDAYREVMRMGV